MLKGIDFVGVSVVYFCHNGKGKFLMHKRSAQARDEHGKWDIGAGGLEVEDSVEKTLSKEIGEEYGTEVLSWEFLGFRDVFRLNEEGKQYHWLALDFKVLVDEAKAKNGEPHKFDAMGWFTLESLPQVSEMHSQLPIFLGKYKDKL